MAPPVPRPPPRPSNISDEEWELIRQRYRRDLQKHRDNLPAWAKSKFSAWYLAVFFVGLAALLTFLIWYSEIVLK